MRTFSYSVVDVFTQTPLEGNALAVLPDARGLSSDEMQRLAREFNLSETTFILPNERAACALRFRIFTPRMEMRFAGHPTLGGAFVALERGLIPATTERLFIEELVGAVPVRIERGAATRMWLTTPPIEFGPRFDPHVCAEVLGIECEDMFDAEPQWVSAGNPNIYVALRDPAAVDRAWVDVAGVRRLQGAKANAGVFVFAPTAGGAYSRSFAPEHSVLEDPATGSATGPLAAYMMQHGFIPAADGTHFVSEQGTKMGRRSLLHVEIRGAHGSGGIDVGGHVVPLGEGVLRLPGGMNA